MKSKALFLLTIFLLSTVVGFCCALHLFHKDDDDANEQHCNFSTNGIKSPTRLVAVHVYISKNDPCCQRAVNDFASLAKQLPQTVKVAVHLPLALTTYYYSYYFGGLPNVQLKLQYFVVQRQRPPTQNIRITIQSFQI